jgi:hypothetical protein
MEVHLSDYNADLQLNLLSHITILPDVIASVDCRREKIGTEPEPLIPDSGFQVNVFVVL